MTLADKIHARLTQLFPDAEVTVQDLTGGGDHFEVIVLSSAFRGKTVIEQHRMLHAALDPLKDAIHALQIKTHAL